MRLATTCPNCGHESPEGARFCTNCGVSLLGEESPAAPAAAPRDTKGRDRTKTGLLLLFIGFVLLAVPLVSLVGAILLLVGAILAYLGADAYGRRHKRHAKWAVLSWILIFVGFIAALVVTLVPVVLAVLEGATAQEVAGPWLVFLVVLGVGAALFGIPYLLLPYRLLSPEQRRLGGAFLAAHVAVAGAQAWYADRLRDVFVAAFEAGGDFSAIQGTQLEDPVFLLFALVNLLWAVLYYLAYRRVAQGVVAPEGAPPP